MKSHRFSMIHRTRWAILALCIFSTLWGIPHPATAATFDPHLEWKTLTTPHFRIHFDETLKPQAEKLATIAERVHQTLSPKYDWSPLWGTDVILTDNNDNANGMATVLPYTWMLIRLTPPEPSSTLATYDDWLTMLFTHEYTHILHLDEAKGFNTLLRIMFGKIAAPNGMTPTWIKEGTAVVEETVETAGGRGRSSHTDMLLRTAIVTGTFPHIDEADGTGWRWPAGQLPYHYGAAFLLYLNDTYGADKLYAFHTRVARSPTFFMMNRHAKKIYGKSFYALWRDWKEALTQRFSADILAASAHPIETQSLTSGEQSIVGSVATSRDGQWVAYSLTSPHSKDMIFLRHLQNGILNIVSDNKGASQLSFSPDGEHLYYSSISRSKRYNAYYDLFAYNLTTRKTTKLTTGARIKDPDCSPDGLHLVAVKKTPSRQTLILWDIANKKEMPLPTDWPLETQLANPRWSPDGTHVVASAFLRGHWDLITIDMRSHTITQLTHTPAIETTPVWKDNQTVYYTSDESGTSNIYRLDLSSRRADQLTATISGLFAPAVISQQSDLLARSYTGKGYAFTRIHGPLTPIRSTAIATFTSPTFNADATPPPSTDYPITDYSPFGRDLFVPRFLLPMIGAIDSGLYLGAMTGGSDPLKWHTWLASVDYRTDMKYVGQSFTYTYARFRPAFYMGYNNYAANFGDISFRNTTTGLVYSKPYYEKRYRGYAGFVTPFSHQSLGLQYFFEKRLNDSLTEGAGSELAALDPNLGWFNGLRASYTVASLDATPAAISVEDGTKLTTSVTVTDSLLGSGDRNEQRIFSGDLRHYQPLPWAHQILAMRVSGGMVWGDTLKQGTFGLGGSLGEGPLTAGTSLFYFPLRGLPLSSLAKTRAMLGSLEYRFPLASPQRGLGTWPFYLKNIHFAPFVDYGNAWNANESSGDHFFGNFFMSTGAELRADFVFGHGLPIVGRLGYGIVVVNRDRLSRLGTQTDPITGQDVKNGMLVLQFGTSF